MDVFDPLKYEDDKKKFLRSLLEMAEADAAKSAHHVDLSLLGFPEGEIAGHAGIDRGLADRITRDLLDDGFIEWMGSGEDGPNCSLTRPGREFVEAQRYEKTFLAKRRKAFSSAKEGAITLSKRAAGWIFGGMWALIAGLGIFAAFRDGILAWIKAHLGIR